jgi:putative ABC transport system substrate-binding protein
MNRRQYLVAASLGLVAGPVALGQSRTLLRIGWLSFARDDQLGALAGLRLGLRDLGYVEGRNLRIDARWGEDSNERLSRLASELVQSAPDLIVAQGPAVFELQRATDTVPIVFVFSGDPVLAGLVDSLARPGRNMTGISQLSLELVGKRLQILKQALPRLKKVAVIANTRHAGEQIELRVSRVAASALGIEVQYLPISSPVAIDAALDSAARGQSEALLVFPDAGMMRQAERIAAFANEHRLPAISGWAEFVHRGNLLSYGPKSSAMFNRLAHYVDRIARGVRPADLPVELPTVLELVVNRKAANAMGLVLPKSLLLQATEVIE